MYLGRAGQEPTENVCLDRPVQNGLSCGLWGSVWLCPELSRTKCFADVLVPWSATKDFAEGLHVSDGVKHIVVEADVGHECTLAMVEETVLFIQDWLNNE